MPSAVHATSVQRRVAMIHASSARRASSAPIPNAHGIVRPT